MVCPACSATSRDDQPACPACGVDFLKWELGVRAKAPSAARLPAPPRGDAAAPWAWPAVAFAAALVFASAFAMLGRDREGAPPPPPPERAAAPAPAPVPVPVVAALPLAPAPPPRARAAARPGRGMITLLPRPDGDSVLKALNVPAGAIRLRLFLDGRPVLGHGPVFWARALDFERSWMPEAREVVGGYELEGFGAGRYAVVARMLKDPTPPSRPAPGDLEGVVTLALDGSGAAADLDLGRVIRLTRPVDNAGSLGPPGKVCGTGAVPLQGPVTFAWEPLSPGIEYRWAVRRVRCPKEDLRMTETGAATTSEVRLALEPSGEGEYYAFSMTAARGARPVGLLRMHGEGWEGPEYPFRVAR